MRVSDGVGKGVRACGGGREVMECVGLAELRSLSRWGGGGGRGGVAGSGGAAGRSAPDVRTSNLPPLGWSRFVLPSVLRRLLPRACAPHCQYSPPYSRGTHSSPS